MVLEIIQEKGTSSNSILMLIKSMQDCVGNIQQYQDKIIINCTGSPAVVRGLVHERFGESNCIWKSL